MPTVRSRSRLLLAPPAPAGPIVPLAAYTVGTEVGVPTGTSLTDRVSLGAADTAEDLELVHPVTGATATHNRQVWRYKRFTGGPSLQPPGGQRYLFDECTLDVSNTNWAVDLNTGGAVFDQMQPLYVFRRCTLIGNDTTARILSGHFVWLIDCHITGGSDGWQGAAFSVAERCNIIATIDTRNPDPHADGVQLTDTGGTTLYQCWISAGPHEVATNAALRIGTEFGAVQDVDVRYCGLDSGGYTVQSRGDAGAGDISNVTFIGNRWVNNALYGPIDFVQTTGITWSDNAYQNGTPIASP